MMTMRCSHIAVKCKLGLNSTGDLHWYTQWNIATETAVLLNKANSCMIWFIFGLELEAKLALFLISVPLYTVSQKMSTFLFFE